MAKSTDATILIVDSDDATRELIAHRLAEEGHPCVGASNASEALAELGAHPYALVLCDILPGADGLELLHRIKQSQDDVTIIILTSAAQVDTAIAALKAGAYDYLTKPLNLDALTFAVRRGLERRHLLEENRDYQQNIEHRVRERRHEVILTLQNAIEALVNALEAKDEYSEGHSRRVAERAVLLGERLKLPAADLERLRLAALLEDVGYIGLREGIISKPGRLTPEEYEHVKTHPLIATRILEPIEELRDLIPIIRHHHERYDGRGYPDGIAGQEIPLASRILALADVFDALISPRPYRSAFSPEMALAIVEGNAGSQFDPELTASFVEMMQGQLRRMRAP